MIEVINQLVNTRKFDHRLPQLVMEGKAPRLGHFFLPGLPATKIQSVFTEGGYFITVLEKLYWPKLKFRGYI